MPIFEVTDPQTGQTVELEGDTPPTEAELIDIFSQLGGAQSGGVDTGGTAGGDTVRGVVDQQAAPGELAIDEFSSFGREALSGLELAGIAASSAIAEPIAGIAGLAQSVNPFADEGAGARAVEATREALTLDARLPETRRAIRGLTGSPAVQAVGKGLEFAEEQTSGRLAEAGFPLTATAVKTIPVAIAEFLGLKGASRLTRVSRQAKSNLAKNARKALADEISSGSINVDNVTKAVSESGDIVTSKASKQALDIISKEVGKERGVQAISVLENMTPASKKQFNRMLDIVEKGSKDPIFKDSNRPMDIVGDAIGDRARAIAIKNKSSGEKIGKIAKSLKSESVDISAPIKQFESDLRGMGVTFSVADDGWVTPDFSRSKFIGGSQKDMTVLVNDLLNNAPDFESAHKLKRQIRDNVDFDAGGTSQIKGDSQKLLKDLSSGIDGVLDSKSSAYRKVNEDFAKTVELKDQFQKMAGKDIDLFEDISSKALGLKGRRMMSNATSGVNIEKTLADADKVLSDFGVRFNDSVPQLNHVAIQLDDLFKLTRPASFQGGIERGVGNVLQGQGPLRAAAGVGADKLRELRAPDFDKKMKVLRALTRQKAK